MRFKEIPGLNDIKEKLTNSSKRNHHAQIFAGSPGSANLALALAYASYINCEDPGEFDSCGVCPACVKIDKFIHPDVHFVFPVSPTQKIKQKDAISSNFMPQWRTLLATHPFISLEDWINHLGENKQVNISKEESRQIIQRLSLKSFEAQFKIMLIWLPEWMHPAAANAILKILEEPSEKTVFLLVTNSYEKLLVTIQSRAQLLNVRSFQTDEITDYLQNQFGETADNAQRIARLSQGNINLAIKHIDSGETVSDESFINWMRSCWENDFEKLVALSEEFHAMHKLGQKDVLNNGLNFLRHALLSRLSAVELLENANGAESKFGSTIDPAKIEQLSTELSQAHYLLERNASAKMIHLDLSLKVGKILKSR